MNQLASKAYKFHAVEDHPSHSMFKKAHTEYGVAIKQAKEQHWKIFLEEITGTELWMAHQYMTIPIGDGGKARIPTLWVVEQDGTVSSITSNEEKGAALCRLFFPAKPAQSLILPGSEYPDHITYDFRPSLAQLKHCVARLSPHKATGDDGILNIVLKESLELIVEYLLHMFRATFTLNTYSACWRTWDTIILWKPGKPRYDLPKAYRPIALMNTIGKLLSAMVAEDLSYMCEQYTLLPDSHFRGRPGRCTMDAMHLLVHKIKSAWQRGKVAAVLYLDIKGAFPNAVTSCLLHNMHMWRVPERYVRFIEQMLMNQQTRLKFDGFVSEWVRVNNGIVQGDPLSMILYLFYNADLIDGAKKGEAKIAYVDDTNYYVEGADFEGAYGKLREMMVRDGGGQDWS